MAGEGEEDAYDLFYCDLCGKIHQGRICPNAW